MRLAAFDLAGSPSCPKLCFLTTGTGDRQSSIDGFYAAFTDDGVDTSHLSLFEKPNMPDVSAHLRGQDVIWVDRGSLANLLAVWRMHALGKVLRDCRESGVVLGGEVRPLTDGLGFLPYSNAVHYGEQRELFQRGIASGVLPGGYATDAGAGLHYE